MARTKRCENDHYPRRSTGRRTDPRRCHTHTPASFHPWGGFHRRTGDPLRRARIGYTLPGTMAREIQLKVRLSEREQAQLAEAAEALGCTVADVVRLAPRLFSATLTGRLAWEVLAEHTEAHGREREARAEALASLPPAADPGTLWPGDPGDRIEVGDVDPTPPAPEAHDVRFRIERATEAEAEAWARQSAGGVVAERVAAARRRRAAAFLASTVEAPETVEAPAHAWIVEGARGYGPGYGGRPETLVVGCGPLESVASVSAARLGYDRATRSREGADLRAVPEALLLVWTAWDPARRGALPVDAIAARIRAGDTPFPALPEGGEDDE